MWGNRQVKEGEGKGKEGRRGEGLIFGHKFWLRPGFLSHFPYHFLSHCFTVVGCSSCQLIPGSSNERVGKPMQSADRVGHEAYRLEDMRSVVSSPSWSGAESKPQTIFVHSWPLSTQIAFL